MDAVDDETWARLAELAEARGFDNYEAATVALHEACRQAHEAGATTREIADVTRQPHGVVRQVVGVSTYAREAQF